MRSWLKTAAAGAVAVALTTVGAVGAAAEVFSPKTFALENGLKAVVIENHRAPVVRHMLWYRVGAMDEPPGKSGIAHFLEHLMFKGTETIAPGEFSKTVARNGGRDNAFTSWDYTAYHQSVAKDRLGLVMQMEADRMVNLVLSDAEVLPERDVILEERSTRIDNSPWGMLGEQMRAAQFMNHPYGRPIIGWRHEMEGLTTQDALDFYERWYAPNNAVLVVSGDVTVEEVKALAQTHYGPIPSREVTPLPQLIEPVQHAPRRITKISPLAGEASMRRTYLAPSTLYGETDHVYPLEVLSDILGGSATSRLHRALVIDQALASSAGAYYSGDGRGPGVIGIYASPRPGGDMAALEAAMDEVIAELLRDGVTEEEVAASIERMQTSAIFARDSLSTGAQVLGAAVTIGLGVDSVEDWPEKIAAVTPEHIAEAAAEVFILEQSVTGILLPKAAETAEAEVQ